MEEQTFIFEGKTTNEAIEKGLKELRTTKSNVEITVLEEETKKTFFSILDPKVVKVEMKLKDKNLVKEEIEIKDINEVSEIIRKFVSEFINNLPEKNIKFDVKNDGQSIMVDLLGEESGYLIGYRGETLNSLQTILSNIASKHSGAKVRVKLNICNYRQKREEDLKVLANRVAESVLARKKSITLEPMNSFDRKVVHTELQKNDKIETHSIGIEPHRKVVVSLKK